LQTNAHAFVLTEYNRNPFFFQSLMQEGELPVYRRGWY
jgi:hypothetical protein